jgi:hypothetical protein
MKKGAAQWAAPFFILLTIELSATSLFYKCLIIN